MHELNYGAIGFSISAIAFTLLSVLIVVSYKKKYHYESLLVASVISVFWALLSIKQSKFPIQFVSYAGLSESFRIIAWTVFINSLISDSRARKDSSSNWWNLLSNWNFKYAIIACCIVVAQSALLLLGDSNNLSWLPTTKLIPFFWLILIAAGLFSLEILYVSYESGRRRTIGHLTVGLGLMFLTDVIVFTDTLLFARINTDLWYLKGFLYALLVPLVALSIARNPQWSIGIHISRQAVNSSFAILAIGSYLLATAVAASLINVSGLSWANVAQVSFILMSGILFLALLMSKKFRSNARVLISKHLFNYKYDYRYEWLKFTKTLTADLDTAPQSILVGLTEIVESKGGLLFGSNKQGNLEKLVQFGDINAPNEVVQSTTPVIEFIKETGWIIDLDEYRTSPETYNNLEINKDWLNNKLFWLVIPLSLHEKLIGLVIIERSEISRTINWEDRDLLKTAGHQAAGLLAQKQAQDALQEAKQFEAFSKLSAYIVHDLKNILGQQSLIVSNAPKHKHKAEFVDDVILTIENSVTRMESLLSQLREPTEQEPQLEIDVIDILKRITINRSSTTPVPSFNQDDSVALYVLAQENKLYRVFSHIIQNAQEATEPSGRVTISVASNTHQAKISIRDTGVGMSSSFVNSKLFTAFESTKGLTGMGIGVFESREYIRSIGGEMLVESTLGEGSTFTILIPLIKPIVDDAEA